MTISNITREHLDRNKRLIFAHHYGKFKFMKSYISKIRFECSKLKGGAVLIKTPLEWDHIAIVRDSTTCETVIDQTLFQKSLWSEWYEIYIF